MGESQGRLSVPADACNFPFRARNASPRARVLVGESSCFRSTVEMIMPPRNPEMPEGTDTIVNGDEGGGNSVGFVAKGGNGSGGTTDKLVSQVREQAASLRGQATD